MNKDYWDTILKASSISFLNKEKCQKDMMEKKEEEIEPDEDVAGSHQNGER